MDDTGAIATEDPPQFGAAYWEKAKRQRFAAVVQGIKTHDDGSKTISFMGGNSFTRKPGEITQLILPGTQAEVEVVHGEVITGLFLPEIKAWAFRMTAQDLADYTREVSGYLVEQQNKARELMVETLAASLLVGLVEVGLVPEGQVEAAEASEHYESAKHLALVALATLEMGPRGAQ